MTPINFGQFNNTLFTMNLMNSIRPTSDFYSMGFGSTSIFNNAFGASMMSTVSMPVMPSFQMPSLFNFFNAFSAPVQMPTFNFGTFGTNVRANFNYTCKTSQASKALNLAASQIGVREIGSTNNGAEVNKYRFGKADGNPWCASFVSWCYGAGQNGNNKKTFGYDASTQSIRRKAERAGFYATKQSGYAPKPGDLAIWKYNNASGHVGIISKINQDGSFEVIEGNCQNKVQKTTRTMASANLHGFVKMDEWLAA